jgi:hypothetical protein
VRRAVGDTVGEHVHHARVPAVLDRERRQVAVRPCDVLLHPGLERQREAALELLAGARQVVAQLGGADVVERVHQGLPLAEPLGERDRPAAPGLGARAVGAQRPELRLVGVGHRQLRTRRKLLELGDRVVREPLGVGVAALEPVQA